MSKPPVKPEKLVRSEDEWRRTLDAEQFAVLRQKGTERAYTGEFWDHHADGRYLCAGCGEALFDSGTKYDSGCGWPAFYAAQDKDRIDEVVDLSHGMRRVEVTCARCGGHLGHVFPDGPQPTGIRYCINSASLKFEPEKE